MPNWWPNQLAPSTTNCDVPNCGRLRWQVLTLLCLWPGIYLWTHSSDTDDPIPLFAALLSSFNFIFTPWSLPHIIFQPPPPPLTPPWSPFVDCSYSLPYQSSCWITCLKYYWPTLLCLFFIHLNSQCSSNIFYYCYPITCLLCSSICWTMIAPRMLPSDLHWSLG